VSEDTLCIDLINNKPSPAHITRRAKSSPRGAIYEYIPLNKESTKANPTGATYEYIPLNRESVKVQLFSKEFILGAAFYSLSLLVMSYYLGTIFVQLRGKADKLDMYVLLIVNVTPVLLA